MKDKGFTLIELLGVIIILTLLITLVLPKVVSSVKNSTKDTNNLTEQIIYDAVKLYVSQNSNDYLKVDGNVYCIAISSLVSEDYLTPPVTISDEDIEKTKTIEVSYNKGFEYKIKNNKECIPVSNELNPKGTYLMINPSVESSDTAFLGGTINRSIVESITITNTKNTPNEVTNSWDVSAAKDGSVMAWYTDTDNNGLYELYIGGEGGVKANPNFSRLFEYFNNVTTMDLKYLDTSDVINMNVLFGECSNLTSINLSNFDTSKVTQMYGMFYECSNLINLDLSHFSTIKVTEMGAIFSGCKNLSTIDLRNSIFQDFSPTAFLKASSLTTIYVKNNNIKTSIENALADINITGVNIIVV